MKECELKIYPYNEQVFLVDGIKVKIKITPNPIIPFPMIYFDTNGEKASKIYDYLIHEGFIQ